MINIALCVLLPIRPDPRPKARTMTHSEMTNLLPSPVGVPYSACPGEMIHSDLSPLLATADAGRRVAQRSELWYCDRCQYTIVVEVDSRGLHRIRNGFLSPKFPT